MGAGAVYYKMRLKIERGFGGEGARDRAGWEVGGFSFFPDFSPPSRSGHLIKVSEADMHIVGPP